MITVEAPMSPGTCAKCGSQDVDYYDMFVLSEQVSWKFKCNDCHARCQESFDMVYASTVLLTEEN